MTTPGTIVDVTLRVYNLSKDDDRHFENTIELHDHKITVYARDIVRTFEMVGINLEFAISYESSTGQGWFVDFYRTNNDLPNYDGVSISNLMKEKEDDC